MSDGLLELSLRGETSIPEGSGQEVLASPLGFEATIERLREGIAAEDLWVIAEINPQMLLAKGGFAIPATRQILFFHPRFMARLLEANAAAIVEAPLKFVLMQAGPETIVRYIEPIGLFGKYAELEDLSRELSAAVRRIADGVKAATAVAA